MERYKVVKSRPNHSRALQHTLNWLDRYICRPKVDKNGINLQGIVGKRTTETGQVVTDAMVKAGDRAADVCPFVRDSMDIDYLCIEESSLDSSADIEALLQQQAIDFKNAAPAYDPMTTNVPAPYPTSIKTFLTIFPLVPPRTPTPPKYPFVDDIYDNQRDYFQWQGLMLGQFYPGCGEAAWPPHMKGILTAPHVSFAIRYMAQHDYLFIKDKSSRGWQVYKNFFPQMASANP